MSVLKLSSFDETSDRCVIADVGSSAEQIIQLDERRVRPGEEQGRVQEEEEEKAFLLHRARGQRQRRGLY